MKSSVALFGLLFVLVVFVATTSARPNHSESDLSNFEDERILDHSEQNRHSLRQRRRHSRQISNGYDYSSQTFYFLMRRIELLEQKVDQLNDFIANRPSPAATKYSGFIAPPIYPIAYFPNLFNPPMEPPCSCNISNNTPKIDDRLRPDTDNSVNTIDEDDNDKGRPISFKPVNSNKQQGRLPPPVEHGSVQAGLTPVTTTTAKPETTPSVCEAAILMCCKYPEGVHRQCFEMYKCVKTFETGRACSQKAIQMVIEHFKKAYAPR